MDVRLNTTVQQFKGKGKLSAAVVKDVNTGETQEVNPGAVFIFIGLDPNTEFLRTLLIWTSEVP
jgi:thioredoxin reductase (NADPH)